MNLKRKCAISLVALWAMHTFCASAADGLLADWSFNQIQNGKTADSAAKVDDVISGNFKATPGVIGSGLEFDGFTTEIVRPAATAPHVGKAFTVEAWLALGAYPWNWCPIIDQSSNQLAGYYFAVGPRGQLSLQVSAGGKWITCTSKNFVLPWRKWVHVTGTFESRKGLTIFVNGQVVTNTPVLGELRPANEADLRIGVIPQPAKPSDIHREHGTLPGWFSLDGILDELKIYSRALSPDEIKSAYLAVQPTSEPDLPLRKMPAGPPGPGRFGAYYEQLKFYPAWDALWRVGPDPDVLVRFDESSARMVFWRGTRYSPAWVSENDLWMADQSVEAWGVGTNDIEGCFEHMQDPHCLYSHVRIIENTDARVVVHWRYAPVSAHNHLWRVDPKTDFACWVDEYYTVYPDAVAVRKVTWQKGTLGDARQFQETLAFTQVGQYCSNVVKKSFCTVANLKGETATMAFVAKPAKEKTNLPPDLTVQRYNFQAENSPFSIYEPGDWMEDVTDRDEREWSSPGACNHWPVGQLHCDGRTSHAPDRPTHFLGFPISNPVVHTNDTREWWNGLYGMTTKSMSNTVMLARSWSQAPELILKSSGFTNDGYNRGDRAYHLTRVEANALETIQGEVHASAESPLVNLALVIQNWGADGASLEIDGQPVTRGKEFRYGYRYELDSTTLLVWIKRETTSPLKFRLKPE